MAKASTTVVGLPVVENAPEVIEFLSEKILKELSTFPDCFYKSEVAKMAQTRLAIVQQEADVNAIEERLGATLQVEELIDEMEDELRLIPVMRDAKIWEAPPEGHEISVEIENSLQVDIDEGAPPEDGVTAFRVSKARSEQELQHVFHEHAIRQFEFVEPADEDVEITRLLDGDAQHLFEPPEARF
jgi:ETC complex I subunit conserved region